MHQTVRYNLDEKGFYPRRPAYKLDAGRDVFLPEWVSLPSWETVKIPLGIYPKWDVDTSLHHIPVLWLLPRSGFSSDYGVFPLTGTVDAGYEGEIKLLLYNPRPFVVQLERGISPAQLVVGLVERQFDERVRARTNKGFGSSD